MTCFNFWIKRRVDEVGPFSCAEICDPRLIGGGTVAAATTARKSARSAAPI